MNSLTIRELLGVRKKTGDVGIEIEMEGNHAFPIEVGPSWRYEEDGSLRGYSCEYVLKRPHKIENVPKLLSRLKKRLKEFGSNINYSERAGVHVHVNVQEMTETELYHFALTYYCLETTLMNFCGPNRVGNHFCLRAKDAEYVLLVLKRAVKRNLGHLEDERIRYASMNFNSLFKYGSLEFRGMETLPSLEKIEDFCHILLRLRDYSMGKEDFTSIPFDISGLSPLGWARQVLGEELFKLVKTPDMEQNIMEDCRFVQDLFYLRREEGLF